MKKINLVKPDLKTGFLDFGKGQEVRYLNVDENLDKKALKNDIAGGAVQFKHLQEYMNKKPSRFNIIYCTNKEDGLMAVSYLAAHYNKIDKLDPDMYDQYDNIEDNQNFEFADFDEEIFYFSDEEGEEDIEDSSQWCENPWKIPVIGIDEVLNTGSRFNPYFIGNTGFSGAASPKNRVPYWCGVRRENVCFLHEVDEFLSGVISMTAVSNALRRFSSNRHVYFVVVLSVDNCSNYEEFMKNIRSQFCELILDYAAGTFDVNASEEEYKMYYRNVFENIIDRNRFQLEKGFKVNKIVDNITSMNNKDKTSMLEKVVLYTIKDEDKPRELREEDFDILKQFDSLGVNLNNKKNKSAEKLKNELVGMEDVKAQVNSIVEVLKYNKRRIKMGLPRGSYHNVHMMLGAPGTAKTTVAELLGKMMAEENLLNGHRFISVNGAELKAEYVGQSAPKVKALFDEYDIIFIDEAYAVCAGHDGESDSFSQEAIAQLIVELEKHGMDRLVMFAGYGGANVSEKDNKMKDFLRANPGIRSRINSTIFFDSYNADEMVEIFKCHAKMGKYILNKKTDELVRAYFAERVSANDFGNGREARSLLENSMTEAAMRLAKIPDDQITEKMMREIKIEDVEAAINKMRSRIKIQGGRAANKFGFVA